MAKANQLTAHQRRRRTFRRLKSLFELVRPYRGRTILAFASMIVATVCTLAPPALTKDAINKGIERHDQTALFITLGFFVIAAFVLLFSSVAQTYLVELVGERILTDLRIRLFNHLQNLSLSFYGQRQTGAIISRITNDVAALDQLVTDSMVSLFGSSMLLIGTLILLFALDIKLALITMTIFPVLLISSIVFRNASATAYRITRETLADITAYLQEVISGTRVVRAYAQEKRHLEEFEQRNRRNQQANNTTVKLNAIYFPGVEFISGLATAVVLLFGGYAAISGHTSIGVVVAFTAALASFFDPIQTLSQFYSSYQSGVAALDKIFEFLEEEPGDIDIGLPDIAQIRGQVCFRNLSFSYGPEDGLPLVLQDFNLEIAAGETVAIVGRTGAGKSTLIKLLARFYDPTSGQILVDGTDISTIDRQSLRRQLGTVPQEPLLFSGSIADNIRFGHPAATMEEVEAAVKSVGVENTIARFPNGYDTIVGERGVKLSAGQRQLVALARAVLPSPRILLLDEATANVDNNTERLIEAGLETAAAGRTTIIVAHRLATVQRADRIVVMANGRIEEIGSHDELLERQGLYWQFYRDWG